jgi:hypothetical protein
LQERIIASALRHKETGQIWTLPAPARHHNIFRILPESMSSLEITSKTEQGFETNLRPFVDRKEAKIIARNADQLLDRASKLNILFSEDVW